MIGRIPQMRKKVTFAIIPKHINFKKHTTLNTVILFWNPDISSYKYDDLQDFIQNHDISTFNWSVWEHEKAKMGDRFFLVKCGKSKNNGICMSGYFISDPYLDEDWTGNGNKSYYMDMSVETAINPQFFPTLPTEDLCSAIPDFDWTGGHSGRILTRGADLLEEMWGYFLNEHSYIFQPQAFIKR